MKERLIGICTGAGACAALFLVAGFRQDAPTTLAVPQETTYCWQLYDRVASYNNEGGPYTSELYLLDSCEGDVWRLSQGKFEPVDRTSD